MATLPTIPASTATTIKKVATDVVTTGVSVGAILAVVLNVAPSIHLGGQYVAWIVTASSVVAAIVALARRVAGEKMAARHAPVPVPVAPVPAPMPVASVTAKKAPAKKAVKKAPAKKAK